MLATAELLQEAALTSSLDEVLARCAREVPLYARRPEFRQEGQSAPPQMQHWPLITKQDMRKGFPANFLGENANLEDLIDREVIELEHTSGTSEERTPLLLPRGWWAEQELRALNLNSLVAEVLRQAPQARRATINSPVCSSDIRYHGMPSRTDRIVDNALFVSLSRFPFLWGQRDLERMTEEVAEWEPAFLDVDPVYAVVLALYCERRGIRFPSLRFILASYEFVSVTHRAILERALGVPVFDLYGSTETGHLLMQDTGGQMRPSLKTAFLEVLHADPSGIGDLVVTTLTNPYMPLVRYSIGDLVQRVETPYETRYVLHGRTADAFITPEGRRVTVRQVDQCFAGIKGIAHYQLLQRTGEAWPLRFVTDHHGPQPHQLRELMERLAQLLQVPIAPQQTDMLAPERSGKFRLGYPVKHS